MSLRSDFKFTAIARMMCVVLLFLIVAFMQKYHQHMIGFTDLDLKKQCKPSSCLPSFNWCQYSQNF